MKNNRVIAGVLLLGVAGLVLWRSRNDAMPRFFAGGSKGFDFTGGADGLPGDVLTIDITKDCSYYGDCDN